MKVTIILFAVSIAFIFSSCFREKTCTCETIDYENGIEISRSSFSQTSRMSKALCSNLEQTTEMDNYKSVTTCKLD
jgi:hypothetical protein